MEEQMWRACGWDAEQWAPAGYGKSRAGFIEFGAKVFQPVFLFVPRGAATSLQSFRS